MIATLTDLGTLPRLVARGQPRSRHHLLDHKLRLPRRCNSMGYYCDSDQLAVIPEVLEGSDVIRRSDSFIGEPPPLPSASEMQNHPWDTYQYDVDDWV